MRNKIQASFASLETLTNELIEQHEFSKKGLSLAKNIIMLQFKDDMLTTDWAKIIRVKPNAVNDFSMRQKFLQRQEWGKGWFPTEKGKEYFILNSKISPHTPVLTKKGAIYLLDMACAGKLPLAK